MTIIYSKQINAGSQNYNNIFCKSTPNLIGNPKVFSQFKYLHIYSHSNVDLVSN